MLQPSDQRLMVEFIHKLTGTLMRVADDRADEYKAAGHTPVADQQKPEEKPAPKKRPVRAKK
jgi:hypothetical protein